MTEQAQSHIQQTILAKKAALADAVSEPLRALAERCAAVWPQPDALDEILQADMGSIPNCHLLYSWNVEGIAISSMVQAEGIDSSWRDRNLSDRPYLKNNLPFKGIMLSSVYKSLYTHKSCVTALQAIRSEDELKGFIAADFAVNDLLRDTQLTAPEMHWQQFRGDPAVRGTVFMQSRAQSRFDDHFDAALASIETFMIEHGVFHAKIHFSSGRCSFWLLEDPYDYRLHGVDEIIDPEFCLAYPLHPYPDKAKITPEQISKVFAQFKALRFADETIYLRSASINIMNGMLGLTFSCDGSHYMPVAEFLERDMSFWIGSPGDNK
ncbi:MAG TPA: hypothetical protein ENI80_12380 [Acidiferrobacteraceae bacterium]|nr:hypothetical protein [Acidiferrobacteraceae bacterium]